MRDVQGKKTSNKSVESKEREEESDLEDLSENSSVEFNVYSGDEDDGDNSEAGRGGFFDNIVSFQRNYKASRKSKTSSTNKNKKNASKSESLQSSDHDLYGVYDQQEAAIIEIDNNPLSPPLSMPPNDKVKGKSSSSIEVQNDKGRKKDRGSKTRGNQKLKINTDLYEVYDNQEPEIVGIDSNPLSATKPKSKSALKSESDLYEVYENQEASVLSMTRDSAMGSSEKTIRSPAFESMLGLSTQLQESDDKSNVAAAEKQNKKSSMKKTYSEGNLDVSDTNITPTLTKSRASKSREGVAKVRFGAKNVKEYTPPASPRNDSSPSKSSAFPTNRTDGTGGRFFQDNPMAVRRSVGSSSSRSQSASRVSTLIDRYEEKSSKKASRSSSSSRAAPSSGEKLQEESL